METPATPDNDSASPVAPDRPVRCPRCGYSQRGLIDSWQDRCPLRGTCTECGLGFSWSEVLRPELHEPRWCVEYAPRRRFSPLPPLLPTLLRSVWPWWFWRSMKMSHAVRPGRLIMFAFMLLLILVACYTIEQSTVAVSVRLATTQSVRQQDAMMRTRMEAEQQRLQAMRGPTFGFSEEERATIAMLQSDIDRTKAMLAGSPSVVNHSFPTAIREAVLTPWAPISSGTVTRPFGTLPYAAPIDLHDALQGYWYEQAATFGGGGWTRPSWLVFNLLFARLPSMAIGMGAGLALVVLMPLSFVLLPASRRKATVRWAHILRVSVYSLGIPTFIGAAMLLLLTGIVVTRGTGVSVLDKATIITAWAPVPLVVLWWRAAIGSYLRLPHAWTITLALAAIDLLVVLAVLWFVVPGIVLAVYDTVMP